MTTVSAVLYIQLAVFVATLAVCARRGREQLVDVNAIREGWRKLSDTSIAWMDSHHVPHWHGPHAHAGAGKHRG